MFPDREMIWHKVDSCHFKKRRDEDYPYHPSHLQNEPLVSFVVIPSPVFTGKECGWNP